MLSFNQKRRLKKLYVSPLVQGILTAVVLALAWNVYARYAISEQMYERRIAAEASVAELAAKKAALETQVQYLTNERGIEAEVRRQFDIAREGEQVVIILDPEPSD